MSLPMNPLTNLETMGEQDPHLLEERGSLDMIIIMTTTTYTTIQIVAIRVKEFQPQDPRAP